MVPILVDLIVKVIREDSAHRKVNPRNPNCGAVGHSTTDFIVGANPNGQNGDVGYLDGGTRILWELNVFYLILLHTIGSQ